MDTTRDKRSSLIRKWRTMIECLVDCKTTDGYYLRVKALAFTQRQPTRVKKKKIVMLNILKYVVFELVCVK